MIYYGRLSQCQRCWLITRSLVNEGADVHQMLCSGELAGTSPDEFISTPDQLLLF
jgi:hypothetical protein